jgi:hypothetical protein
VCERKKDGKPGSAQPCLRPQRLLLVSRVPVSRPLRRIRSTLLRPSGDCGVQHIRQLWRGALLCDWTALAKEGILHDAYYVGSCECTDHWSQSCIDIGLGKCRMPVLSQWHHLTTNMADPEEGPLRLDSEALERGQSADHTPTDSCLTSRNGPGHLPSYRSLVPADAFPLPRRACPEPAAATSEHSKRREMVRAQSLVS